MQKRIKDHIGRFTKMYLWLKEDEKLINENKLTKSKMDFLKNIEEKDCIFPEINYELYK